MQLQTQRNHVLCHGDKRYGISISIEGTTTGISGAECRYVSS